MQRSVKRTHKGYVPLAALIPLLANLWFPAPASAGQTLTDTGSVLAVGIPFVAGLISLGKHDDEGVVSLAATFAVAYGATQTLKVVVNKRRPNGGKHSFPSGHMTAAMAGASYLHYRYGWKYGLPAYAAAAVVGASRVKGGFHRWEDIVGGAAIANIAAYVFTDTLNENVVVIPVVDMSKKNFGIFAGFRF